MEEVLRRIEEFASKKHLPIVGPEKGKILDEVVITCRPMKAVEVGSLVGYSAIRIARLLPEGGRLVCLEVDRSLANIAAKNVRMAGLEGRVRFVVGDAKLTIPKLNEKIDMLFIDAEKSEYLTYLMLSERLLHPGSVVVADNVKIFENEVSDYLDRVRNSGLYNSITREVNSLLNPGVKDAMEISVKL